MTPDVYNRVTDKIIAELEKGERPWLKPWNAEHAAGKITRPLRHNGLPYSGINVVMLWAEAMEKGYNAPLWMTFKQAQELGGHVRKGKHGSLVVYANTITKTEQDETTGEDVEHHIPFMKGYTVFNIEQIDDHPPTITPRRKPRSSTPRSGLTMPNSFSGTRAQSSNTAAKSVATCYTFLSLSSSISFCTKSINFFSFPSLTALILILMVRCLPDHPIVPTFLLFWIKSCCQ